MVKKDEALGKDRATFLQWLDSLTDANEWMHDAGGGFSISPDTMLWLDGPEDTTLGYGFEVGSSAFSDGATSVYAIKVIVSSDGIETDPVWFEDFSTATAAWTAADRLRGMMLSAGLEAVMNQVEAWMLDRNTLEINVDSPYLFSNQKVPCPFRTLLAKSIAAGRVLSPKKHASAAPEILPGCPVYQFEARRNADGSVSVCASKYHSAGVERREVCNYVNTTHEDWNGLNWNNISLDDYFEFASYAWTDFAWIAAYNDVQRLDETKRVLGLEAAIQLAESWGVNNSLIDPNREDVRFFISGGEGEADAFVSLCQKNRAQHGRAGDPTVRYAIEPCTHRYQGNEHPAIILAKYWESDLYRYPVLVYIGEQDEDITGLVMEWAAMLNDPLQGYRAVLKAAEALSHVHKRLRRNSWTITQGPKDSVESEPTENDANALDFSTLVAVGNRK